MSAALTRGIIFVVASIIAVVAMGCSQSSPQPTPIPKSPVPQVTATALSTTIEPTILSQPTAIPSHGGPIRDHVSFVDALRARGYTVDIVDSVEQPFLRGTGTILRVSGGNLTQPIELQSFNYQQEEVKMDPLQAAAQDAQQIEPSGQPSTMRIEWIAPPHFYHKERVIVLYVGSDSQALALLKELLGPPFAGK
ncbi:MAG TPA: hypothetical protein VFD70_09625 [Anaerolineae bacterium]|nr:hypothetical protein [Anaerolineae bacterium]